MLLEIIGAQWRCACWPASSAGRAAVWPSFNHFVGAGKQIGRQGDPEGVGRLEIDHQFKSRGLLNWKIAGLFALENLVHVVGNTGKCRCAAKSTICWRCSRVKGSMSVRRATTRPRSTAATADSKLERIRLKFEHSLRVERSSCILLPGNRQLCVRSCAPGVGWCAPPPCADEPSPC